MDEYESLSHTIWDCKYHVVFIPKCRRKTLYQELRRHLGEVFRKLAHQKESKVEEGHLMPDHVHMLLSIPPKYAVSHHGRANHRDTAGAGGGDFDRRHLSQAWDQQRDVLRVEGQVRRPGSLGRQAAEATRG